MVRLDPVAQVPAVWPSLEHLAPKESPHKNGVVRGEGVLAGSGTRLPGLELPLLLPHIKSGGRACLYLEAEGTLEACPESQRSGTVGGAPLLHGRATTRNPLRSWARPESRGPSPGQGAGPPQQVPGLEAEQSPAGPRGPDPPARTADPPPARTGACDPGPGSREFRADAASPHSGPGAHWLRRGPRGGTGLARRPSSPGSPAAARPVPRAVPIVAVTKSGDSAARSWGRRLTPRAAVSSPVGPSRSSGLLGRRAGPGRAPTAAAAAAPPASLGASRTLPPPGRTGAEGPTATACTPRCPRAHPLA
ncbi:collagen alpha-1(III) chain-like [Meles meles]|uniref:collagen alpha-1(III) chain-like n=1 Tax=Meles meles TaxID=9662 RepID=UPI001E6A08D2|nr:collagen alpha-1(III) chain-like [Meles meles]